MNEKEYLLKLSLSDVNTILGALGNMPFAQVYGLIHKIHQQAEDQDAGNELQMKNISKPKSS